MAIVTQSSDTPLMDLLRGCGAKYEPVNGTPVAVSYGDVRAEYEVLGTGAAVADLGHTTRVLHKGGDALDLLNRLTTNDLGGLAAGGVSTTVLTSEIGRVIDVFQVVCLATDQLMLISESNEPGPLIENIEKYTILEDAVLEDVSSGTARIGIRGPLARAVTAEITGTDMSAVDSGGAQPVPILGEGAVVLKGNPFIREGYDLVFPAGAARQLWETALNAGAAPVGHHALEHARIKAGLPAPGTELTDRVNPLEAGLDEFVSFTKGCYVGQEVIARLDTYDKVQRRLVGLEVPEGAEPGETLNSGRRTAGWVTSVSTMTNKGRSAALGYVRRAFIEPGTVLGASSGEVNVVETPSTVRR